MIFTMIKKLFKLLSSLSIIFLFFYGFYIFILFILFPTKLNNNDTKWNYFFLSEKKHEIYNDEIYNIFLNRLQNKLHINNINMSNYYKVFENIDEITIQRNKYYYIEINYFNNLKELMDYSNKIQLNTDFFIDFDYLTNKGNYILYAGPYSMEKYAENDLSHLNPYSKIVLLEELYAYQNVLYFKNIYYD